MPRYAAFLRGVMPTNCKMPALKAAFEAAGFADVKTVLGSGNVVFDARSTSVAALEQKAEAAMHEHLGQAFMTFIRPLEQCLHLSFQPRASASSSCSSATTPTMTSPNRSSSRG